MAGKIVLNTLTSIDGFKYAALVDSESGLALATEGSFGSGAVNTDILAAGNAEVLNAKRRVAKSVGIEDQIEDILITFEKSYHILRPLERNTQLFLYLALDRSRANLGMARHQLKAFEQQLDFS